MPQIYRLLRDFKFGTLPAPGISASATTITNPQFASLPAFSAGDAYLPMTLMDPTAQLGEVIWVVAHASGSNDVTVQRGKEGSTALPWSAGTVWQCAPTAQDGLAEKGVATSPYVGQRVLDGSSGRVEEYTYNQGWQPSAGAFKPGQAGLAADGTSMPGYGVGEIRCGTTTVTTNGSGFATVSLASPFTNKHAGGVLCSADESLFVGSMTWLAPTLSNFQFVAAHYTGSIAASINIKLNYWCWGW